MPFFNSNFLYITPIFIAIISSPIILLGIYLLFNIEKFNLQQSITWLKSIAIFIFTMFSIKMFITVPYHFIQSFYDHIAVLGFNLFILNIGLYYFYFKILRSTLYILNDITTNKVVKDAIQARLINIAKYALVIFVFNIVVKLLEVFYATTAIIYQLNLGYETSENYSTNYFTPYSFTPLILSLIVIVISRLFKNLNEHKD